jgi:hypothetical protein
MTRIVVDHELLSRLRNLAEPLEFCTEGGFILGTFTPLPDREAALRVEPVVSEEELRRRAEGDGYTTDEVIAHLESL